RPAKTTLRLPPSGGTAGPAAAPRTPPFRPPAGLRAAFRPAAVRPPYSCGITDNAVSLTCRTLFESHSGLAGLSARIRPNGRLMKLRDLFSDETPIDKQAGTINVCGLAMDSRVVKPGDLFFALAGSKT